MAPGIGYLIPWFILFTKAKLIDTYTALILTHLIVALPLVLWVMIGFFEDDEGIPVAVVHLGPEVVTLADRQRWQHIGGARLVRHGGRVRSAYRTGPGPDHRTGPWMPATRPPPLGTRAWQTTTFCLTRPERPPMIAPAWAVSIADRAAHLSRWAEDQCDDTTRPTGSNRGSGYPAAPD